MWRDSEEMEKDCEEEMEKYEEEEEEIGEGLSR